MMDKGGGTIRSKNVPGRARSRHSLVSIDGPVAAGKTSVSRGVASRLGWQWLSTGAFYRGLAYVALQEGLLGQGRGDATQEVLSDLAVSKLWRVALSEERTLVLYKGRDVTRCLRSEQVDRWASLVSRLPQVREALLPLQRGFAKSAPRGLVVEGRDCGTVVFPHAGVKFFLQASPKSRAVRRAKELQLELSRTQAQQEQRDKSDSSRTHAPLKVPEGAHCLDTTDLGLDEVVQIVLERVRESLWDRLT